MNDKQDTRHGGETPVYDAGRGPSHDAQGKTARNNAASRNFPPTDEYLDVIHTLVDHYKTDCKTRDCLAAHEHLRFLEDAYASKGGSKYLYMLFDALPVTRGVLTPIRQAAGLASVRQEAGKGFGSAF